MLPMSESLEVLELTDFLSVIKKAGAIDDIDAKNITIFAPSNEAVEDYIAEITQRVR